MLPRIILSFETVAAQHAQTLLVNESITVSEVDFILTAENVS